MDFSFVFFAHAWFEASNWLIFFIITAKNIVSIFVLQILGRKYKLKNIAPFPLNTPFAI